MHLIKIELNDKTYGIDKIKASAIKKIIAFQKKNAILQAQAQADGVDKSEEMLNMMAEFIVSIYNNQFTIDELWEGLELSDLQPAFDNAVSTIMSVFTGEDTKKK